MKRRIVAAGAQGAIVPILDPAPSPDDLASRYLERIRRIALRLTRDRDEADDLTQDVMVRVLANLHRYEPGTFDGWLYRITRNLFLDGIRRRRHVDLQTLPDGDWRQPVQPGPGPGEQAEAAVLRDEISDALARLPEHLRTVVSLRDLEDRTYAEIADAIGRPVGTVRSRLHRGRRQLRAVLEARRASDGDLAES